MGGMLSVTLLRITAYLLLKCGGHGDPLWGWRAEQKAGGMADCRLQQEVKQETFSLGCGVALRALGSSEVLSYLWRWICYVSFLDSLQGGRKVETFIMKNDPSILPFLYVVSWTSGMDLSRYWCPAPIPVTGPGHSSSATAAGLVAGTYPCVPH